MLEKDSLGAGHRQYIRLDSVFPVQFRILSLDGQKVLSDWLQGFTNNISKGGICLAVNNLKPELAKVIKDRQVKLSLDIEMPLAAAGVPASARVAWVKDITGQPNKYLIGLSYAEIASLANSRIIRYAMAKRLFVPVSVTIIIILALGFVIGSYINVRLIKGNKALVEQLVKILQESSIAKQTIKAINKEREGLQLKMQALQLRIRTAEEEKAKLEVSETAQKINEFNAMIEKLIQEKTALQEQLIAVQHRENTVTDGLLRLDKTKATLEKANLDKMYQWLKIHQNPRSGLVMSFEGDRDIENWAFTYDQALAIQAYANFGDFERAKKLLDFFSLVFSLRQKRRYLNNHIIDNPVRNLVK